MSRLTQTGEKPASAVMREVSGSSKNYKAWVAKGAKQPMVLETLDIGPLGAEEAAAAAGAQCVNARRRRRTARA